MLNELTELLRNLRELAEEGLTQAEDSDQMEEDLRLKVIEALEEVYDTVDDLLKDFRLF